jgi:7-cyano-7-deazaguanine synthase
MAVLPLRDDWAPVPTATGRVLLLSGGMDSLALDLLWKPDVRLYVDMGTRYAAAERRALSRLDLAIQTVMLPLDRFELPDGIIPLRNLMLCAIAAQFGDSIALAATAGDRVLDKSEPFAWLTSELLSYLWKRQHWTDGKSVHVALPTKSLSKRELVKRYIDEGGDPLWLAERSLSCYEPSRDDTPCGICKPCLRKWVAFAANGIEIREKWAARARAEVVDEIVPQIKRGTYDRSPSESRDVLDAIEL